MIGGKTDNITRGHGGIIDHDAGGLAARLRRHLYDIVE
jgi:hypothetical protein